MNMNQWEHEALRNDIRHLNDKNRQLEDDLDALRRRFEEFERRVIRKWQGDDA